jgi:hypothetical protein
MLYCTTNVQSLWSILSSIPFLHCLKMYTDFSIVINLVILVWCTGKMCLSEFVFVWLFRDICVYYFSN